MYEALVMPWLIPCHNVLKLTGLSSLAGKSWALSAKHKGMRHDIKGKEKTHAAPNFCKDLEVSLALGHGMANKLVILHADCSYLGFKKKTTVKGCRILCQRLVLANCLSI